MKISLRGGLSGIFSFRRSYWTYPHLSIRITICIIDPKWAHENFRKKSVRNQPNIFGRLKTELVHGQRYRSSLEARLSIFNYLEVFYNCQMSRSALGYRSPEQYQRLLNHVSTFSGKGQPESKHNVFGITEYLQRVQFYIFFRIFCLANPYKRRGSLRNAFVKSGPLTSPIRRAFLMIWMTCDRS